MDSAWPATAGSTSGGPLEARTRKAGAHPLVPRPLEPPDHLARLSAGTASAGPVVSASPLRHTTTDHARNRRGKGPIGAVLRGSPLHPRRAPLAADDHCDERAHHCAQINFQKPSSREHAHIPVTGSSSSHSRSVRRRMELPRPAAFGVQTNTAAPATCALVGRLKASSDPRSPRSPPGSARGVHPASSMQRGSEFSKNSLPRCNGEAGWTPRALPGCKKVPASEA